MIYISWVFPSVQASVPQWVALNSHMSHRMWMLHLHPVHIKSGPFARWGFLSWVLFSFQFPTQTRSWEFDLWIPGLVLSVSPALDPSLVLVSPSKRSFWHMAGTTTSQEPPCYDCCRHTGSLLLKKKSSQITLEWPLAIGWAGDESLGFK